MGKAAVSKFGWIGRPCGAIAILIVGLSLAGCGAGAIADLPAPIGLPQGTPARPNEPGEYPNVYDRPAKETDALLNEREQARLQKDLTRVHARQTGQPEPKGEDKASKPSKPGKPVSLKNSGE